MTTTDYLINSLFLLVVLRQAHERKLDVRTFVLPLVLVFIVARQYIHTIPTAGNDLVLIGLLATVGLTSGILSGLATHVRLTDDGNAAARIGWIAGILLVAGIGSRMVFSFAVSHGAGPAVASFSAAHHIGAAAWPVAMVAMAMLEVALRQIIVHYRGYRLATAGRIAPAAIAATA
jgi:hypothetical protein